MHPLTLAAVLALAAPPPAVSPDPRALAVPAADVERAGELVRKLGSPSYRDREQAAADLRKLGRRAIPALAAGSSADDPEVRVRCETLLPAAELDDLDARLAAFQADADQKFIHDLPGWDKFRDLTDGDPQSKAFFAEMMRAPAARRVFAAVPKGKDEFGRRLAERNTQIYQNLFPQWQNGLRQPVGEVTTIDFATVLLGETLKAADKDAAKGVAGGFGPINLVYHNSFKQAIESDKHAPVVRKLLLGWCESWPEPNGSQLAMNVTTNLNMKEAAKYAEKVLAADGQNAWTRAQAVCTVARFGGKAKLPELEKLFGDTTAIPRGAGQTAMEVRDIALVMAVLVSGKSVADYGYAAQNFGAANDQMKFNPWVYSLSSAEARTKAFAKWKDERAKDAAPKK